MNDHNQDPFAKYDKLFEDQAKEAEKNIAKNDHKHKKTFRDIEKQPPRPRGSSSSRSNPARIILTVIFVILAFQALPFIVFNSTGMTIMPIFSFIFFFVIINIIIKAFKR